MARKLDALLGRNFRAPKFKTLSKLASSRIAILSNKHQIQLSHARSDVKQLLLCGQQDCAMLRVEHVIMEQNKLDALSLIELFCQLLLERVKLIAQSNGECPQELKEATSSLIHAASRCREFSELQKIREVLTAKFGKDFATRAVESHNNCEVNPKKFSTRQQSLGSRLKFLKEIASGSGVTLNLEEYTPAKDKVEKFSESMKARRKYTDVADAAQEAFESAAYAAAAARAAVELSVCKSMDNKNHDGSDNQGGTVSNTNVSSRSKTLMVTNFAASEKLEDLVNRLNFENKKIQPVEDPARSESEGEDDLGYESLDDNRLEEEVENDKKETERKSYDSSSDDKLSNKDIIVELSSHSPK